MKARYFVMPLSSQREQANDAARSIGGRGQTFGSVSLVPAVRPMLCGPAERDVACWNLTDKQRATLETAFVDAGVDYVIEPDPAGVKLRDATISERLGAIETATGCAPQQVTEESLASMPAEEIEALIATVDAKGIEDGVLDWITDGVRLREDASAISVAMDAKAAEVEKAAIEEPPK